MIRLSSLEDECGRGVALGNAHVYRIEHAMCARWMRKSACLRSSQHFCHYIAVMVVALFPIPLSSLAWSRRKSLCPGCSTCQIRPRSPGGSKEMIYVSRSCHKCNKLACIILEGCTYTQRSLTYSLLKLREVDVILAKTFRHFKSIFRTACLCIFTLFTFPLSYFKQSANLRQ